MFYYKMRRGETIRLNVPESVYEPREDSLLIAKVLEGELESGLEGKSKSVLEIGCGSGLLSILTAKNGCPVLAADIDPNAVACARQNAELNEASMRTIQSDLFQNISGKFGLIIFNPPYLAEEQTENSRTWAGGNMLEVVTRFIRKAKRFLEDNGKILVVISSLSKPENILKEFTDGGFNAKIIEEQKIPWEKLFVICAKTLR